MTENNTIKRTGNRLVSSWIVYFNLITSTSGLISGSEVTKFHCEKYLMAKDNTQILYFSYFIGHSTVLSKWGAQILSEKCYLGNAALSFTLKSFFFFFWERVTERNLFPVTFQPSRLSYHQVFVKNCPNKIRQYTCKLLLYQDINQFTTSHNFFTLHIVFADFVIPCSFLASRNHFQNQKFFTKGLKILKEL